jgi:hypothetical protein
LFSRLSDNLFTDITNENITLYWIVLQTHFAISKFNPLGEMNSLPQMVDVHTPRLVDAARKGWL